MTLTGLLSVVGHRSALHPRRLQASNGIVCMLAGDPGFSTICSLEVILCFPGTICGAEQCLCGLCLLIEETTPAQEWKCLPSCVCHFFSKLRSSRASQEVGALHPGPGNTGVFLFVIRRQCVQCWGRHVPAGGTALQCTEF